MHSKKLKSKVIIIAFSDDIYKFHYALTMASTLSAIEKKVSIFISGYACNYIRKDWIDRFSNKITKKILEKKMPSLKEMFTYCKELNVNIYYCETALNFLDIDKSDLIESIQLKPLGMYTILNSHKKDEMIFI